jgi:hypothetical protein
LRFLPLHALVLTKNLLNSIPVLLRELLFGQHAALSVRAIRNGFRCGLWEANTTTSKRVASTSEHRLRKGVSPLSNYFLCLVNKIRRGSGVEDAGAGSAEPGNGVEDALLVQLRMGGEGGVVDNVLEAQKGKHGLSAAASGELLAELGEHRSRGPQRSVVLLQLLSQLT